MQSRLSFRRAFGFFLTLGSVLLLISVVPVTFPLGAVALWLAVWVASAGVFIGCFMMFEMTLREFMKPLLAGILSLLIMNIVFITPISFELQLIIAALSILMVALLSRYYLPRKSQETTESTTVQSPSLPKKAAGYALIAASALLFIFIVPEALTYGLLITSLVIVLVIAVGVAGYAQISPMSLRQFIGWLISAFIVVLLPFAFILPTEYQVLIGSLVIIAIALLFYWGYQKIKKEQKKP